MPLHTDLLKSWIGSAFRNTTVFNSTSSITIPYGRFNAQVSGRAGTGTNATPGTAASYSGNSAATYNSGSPATYNAGTTASYSGNNADVKKAL